MKTISIASSYGEGEDLISYNYKSYGLGSILLL